MSDLESARMKLARANHHLHELWRELKPFTESLPCSIRSETNLKGIENQIRCDYFVESLRPPPRRFSLITGDVLSDLRCALDHAAWALVVQEKGPRFAERNRAEIYFPICEKEGHFKQRHIGTFLSPEALAAIERAQPYCHSAKHPRRDALWALGELANIDKHRAVHLVVFQSGEALIRTTPELPGGTVQIVETGPLYVGAHTIRFTAPRPRPYCYVEVEAQITVKVAIEEGPRTPSVPLQLGLREMLRRVREALNELRAFDP